jgi:ABC-type polysaccharide/polyol phosphate transport system ATPase subunit
VWLEDTLKNWKRILLMVSHSQDFLNGVCTNIINMQQKKLQYYTGEKQYLMEWGYCVPQTSSTCSRRNCSTTRVSYSHGT